MIDPSTLVYPKSELQPHTNAPDPMQNVAGIHFHVLRRDLEDLC